MSRVFKFIWSNYLSENAWNNARIKAMREYISITHLLAELISAWLIGPDYHEVIRRMTDENKEDKNKREV
jgi:hypothetical protein